MALNPIAYTEKVVDGFLRYQVTTYPFADRNLADQLRRLLSLDATRNTPLLQGPFIKLSAAFRPGAAVEELVQQGALHPHMRELIQFPHVYGHQEKAIRAICEGRTTLVSTGTGSGKTECFLYPIISRCLALRDEKAADGITAVLIYPMNALAEDQLDRLRGLLAGTGVTFGMYVGKTPEKKAEVAGERLREGSSAEAYRRACERAERDKRETAVHPAEERCSREEMQAKPPRILLTNVKQLELLLTRQRDVALFASARLEFLVFDEAHTFTGALGAETACLIRRLRAFCGKETRDTVCVGTSATIVDPVRGAEAGREFASRFFGVPREAVALVGEEYEPDAWGAKRTQTPAPADARDALRRVLDAVSVADTSAGSVAAAHKALATRELVVPDGSTWEEALFDSLSSNELVFQVAEVLARPRSLLDLLAELKTRLGRSVTEEEVLGWLALGAAARREGRPLLRPVVHAFVRGIGSALVTLPDASGPRLQFTRDVTSDPPLHGMPLLTCTTCGQHYFEHHVSDMDFTGAQPGGGQAHGERRVWEALSSDLGGRRVLLLDRVVSDDGDDDDAGDDDDDAGEGDVPVAPPRRAAPAARPRPVATVFFCRPCGTLHDQASDRCLSACGREGPLVPLSIVRQKPEYPGRLTRCVSCGARGMPRGTLYREPARPVRAVQVSDVHVLAQEMLQHAERPRLLVFADSRQDAAFQAGWMRDHARRFRMRALMWERLRQGSLSIGDLVAHLDDALDADDSLSRALVPEVWAEVRKEAEGRRHIDERRYLLRVLVLREVTTGVKQRVGLEPWGRLRVEYAGLSAELRFIQHYAAMLGVEPGELLEGVGAMLDRIRRQMVLYDREHRLFSRLWQDGSREVQAGYFPIFSGVPKGLKLQREPDDRDRWVTQLLSARGDTFARQAARIWGVPADGIDEFLRGLWTLLTDELHLLVPVTLQNWRGRVLAGSNGVTQIDADRIRLAPHKGVYRCNTCRRAHVRMPPHQRCLAWRCTGTLREELENPDDYDLRLIDGSFRMVRPREHSAQVPPADREVIERSFKGESETINTLVSTPTLEMGVDIGALDAVLMRNVPPRPSNYWQRAGRAGRRHRMAVNITYARPTSHDQAYFGAPLKLLEGRVEPPRFNLRNQLMVEKHVHAALLTRLHQLSKTAGTLSQFDRDEVTGALEHAFPHYIRTYLFDERSEVRNQPYDLTLFAGVVSKHEEDLVRTVVRTFGQGWPEVDAEVVSPDRLREVVRRTVEQLELVIGRLRKRLDWALGQMRRLDEVRRRKGTLDREDDEPLYRRCDRIVKRLKGSDARQRNEAEGYDDTVTMGVLAAQGFLPGYGLEVGAVIGTSEARLEFENGRGLSLPRPPSMALREFAPGNLLYANGGRFTPRVFHLEAEETPLWFRVDLDAGALVEERAAPQAADNVTAQGLANQVVRAVRICDVDLAHRSRISDDEEFRFQPPMETFGYELGQHDGGQGFLWDDHEVLLRKGVRFRMANVGASRLVEAGRGLGFPLCLRCGQSRSPFASAVELQTFRDAHRDRCGQPAAPTGFYADITATALSFRCASHDEAYSLLESLRFGAARVLDMETDDLQLLVIGRAGSEEVDALLYDPMPGGSGLLDQLCERFPDVAAQARAVAAECPARCTRSCIDCLQTFRNGFYHSHLDRNLAVARFEAWGDSLRTTHEVPPRHPSTPPAPQQRPVNDAERRLREMMSRAGFPSPAAQHVIDFGRPHGTTTPDFFFPTDEPNAPGTCIYLDGLSGALHGNPETQRRDIEITNLLESRGYFVVRLPASELDDRAAMARFFYTLGKELLGRDRARAVRDETGWFEGDAPANVVPFERVQPSDEEKYATCVPLVTLKAAAGKFGDAVAVEEAEWVRPATRQRLHKGMFVAQIVGKSMEPRIPDGAYCLFAAPLLGHPNAKVALVQLRSPDIETGGAYTVKKLEEAGDRVRLVPLNTAFEAMEFAADEEDVRPVAELVQILPEA